MPDPAMPDASPAKRKKRPKAKPGKKKLGGGGNIPKPEHRRMNLRDLDPASYNPRTISEKAKKGLSFSIRKFGLVEPIVWNRRSGVIVGGHQRRTALIDLGEPEADVLGVDLDEAGEKALNVALNNPEIQGEFNENIGALLAEIRERDAALFTGLRLDVLSEDLIASLQDGAKGDGPSGKEPPEPKISMAEELRAKWGTKLGQIWQVGPHRIACGDSRDPAVFGRLFGDERAVWCWTDPPYGVSYVGKTEDALEIENVGSEALPDLLRLFMAAVDTILVPGAPIYVAHPAGRLSVEFGKAFLQQGWFFHETLVWVKDSMVLGRSDYHYKHEPLIYGWKSGAKRPWYAGRDKTSVFEIARPKRSELHPTMKPPALVETHIGNSSRKGDLGVEPFGGSGTTICAAQLMERRCYAVELDPRFVAVALERLTEMGLEAVLVAHQAG